MIRTASDLFQGAHIRDEDGILIFVEYLVVGDDDSIYIDGFEVETGETFEHTFDPDDEINIVKGE